VSRFALFAWAKTLHQEDDFKKVSDSHCESEMDAVLSLSGGVTGHAAFTRFRAGTGGTEVYGPGTALNGLALTAPSYRATRTSVTKAIERNLATQVSHFGAVDPCAVSIGVIPPTHFALGGSDPVPLQAVIGGTHGEELFLVGFAGSALTRTYAVDLHFLICDNFGVDEHDLYAPGLIPFWILQHQRDPTRYAPFVTLLDLTTTVTGTF
jgi:hypothetical protein